MVLIRPTVLPTPESAALVANHERDKLPGVKAAEAEYRASHHPQSLRTKFEADEEQQHHHAEAGNAGDIVDIGNQAQTGGADDDSGKVTFTLAKCVRCGIDGVKLGER